MALLRLLLCSSLIFVALLSPTTSRFIRNVKNKNKNMKNESRIAINRCFPDYITPEYYNISIIPYAKIDSHFHTLSAPYTSKEEVEGSFILYGTSSININITFSTKNITLHLLKSKVDLSSIRVFKKLLEKDEFQEKNYTFFMDDTRFILRFSNGLEPGAYVLKTEFLGNISDNEGVFFRTFYKNDKGNGRLIVGDLQAIRSRYVFPCPYEPLKSDLVISLEYDEMYTVKSNVPKQMVSYTIRNNSVWTDIYNISVMATYFVAFGSSDFDIYSNLAENINMIYRRQLAGRKNNAWKIIENVTSYLNYQLHTNNSMKTLIVNHIVLPDFLERDTTISGVVFHRETDIIYNEAFDHPARIMETKRSITRNVAYGLLGNIPFWLKDGFAILLFSGIHRPMNLFIVQNQHESLYLNSKFNREYFLKKKFSYPGYFKAPFMLRMLQHLITDKVFQKIIKSYLCNALNSTTENFWTIMENTLYESDLFMEDYNLTERINRWTQLESYPILTVTRANNDFMNLEIKYDNPQNVGDWWIPVSFTSRSNPKFTRTSLDKYYRVLWIQYTSQKPLSRFRVIPYQDSWVIANIQQTCPYRVNYDIKNWQGITMYLDSLKFKQIHIINRAQIIDDAFHLAIEKELEFSIFWNLTTYLKRETNYEPWYPMFKALEYMSSIFPLPDKRVGNITGKINEILHRVLMTIDYKENSVENPTSKSLRQEAVKWACTLGLKICTKMASANLDRHFADPEKHKLLPWWKEWTYCKGLISANYENWLKVRNIWMTKRDNEFLKFLACSQDPIIIAQYLESLKSQILSDNATIYIFHSIIEKHAKNDKIFNDIIRFFLDIKPRPVSIIAAVIDIINHVYSKKQLDKVRSLVQYVEKPYRDYIDQKIKKRLSEITSQMEYLKLFSD